MPLELVTISPRNDGVRTYSKVSNVNFVQRQFTDLTVQTDTGHSVNINMELVSTESLSKGALIREGVTIYQVERSDRTPFGMNRYQLSKFRE